MIVDAWGQHPTLRHAQHEMFASLRRWNRQEVPTEQMPVSETLRAMDGGGVDRMLISAWHGPGEDERTPEGAVRLELPDDRARQGVEGPGRPGAR